MPLPENGANLFVSHDEAVPLSKPPHRKDDFFELDKLQIDTLKSAMACESRAPFLIIGSFGTGKTRLLARLAYEIMEKKRKSALILICAHHQASADAFVTNYFGRMPGMEGKVCRLVSDDYNFNQNFAEFYATARAIKMSGYFPRIIITTHSTSLHLRQCMHDKGYYFTHILMDEGAQTREPESIAPLCMARSDTTLIIAGDHKQVGPSLLVLGDEARDNGLKFSLLERLHGIYNSSPLKCYSETHCATLLNNYRCHRALLSLPSYLFYNSTLVPKAQGNNTWLHPMSSDFPLHFICSSLNDEVLEVKEGISEVEADILLEEVKKYCSSWPVQEWGSNFSSVCIMTATPNQVSLY